MVEAAARGSVLSVHEWRGRWLRTSSWRSAVGHHARAENREPGGMTRREFVEQWLRPGG